MMKFLVPFVALFLLCPSVIWGVRSSRMSRDIRRGNPCPESWDVSPCKCGGRAGAISMECDKITSGDQLAQIFKANKEKLNFRDIRIEGSSLPSLSADVFNSQSFFLFLMTNSSIEKIDNDAFKGSEKVAEVIRLDGNRLTSFPFASLTGFDQLKLLQLERNQLTELKDEAFPELKSLTLLSLHSNKISSLGKNVFSHLKSLGRLDLSNNELTTLGPRSLAFDGQKESPYVILANNKISQIDQDAFAGLKAKLIDLSDNKLTTLNERPFSQLLKDGTELIVTGNSFDCDKPEMAWLKKLDIAQKQIINGFLCSNGKNLGNLK